MSQRLLNGIDKAVSKKISIVDIHIIRHWMDRDIPYHSKMYGSDITPYRQRIQMGNWYNLLQDVLFRDSCSTSLYISANFFLVIYCACRNMLSKWPPHVAPHRRQGRLLPCCVNHHHPVLELAICSRPVEVDHVVALEKKGRRKMTESTEQAI
jgi:hypothetical protein